MSDERRPPAWYSRPYGKDPGAWEEARQQCRRTLVRWAKAGKYGTYTELIRDVDAISWPQGAHTHEGAQVGRLLGDVSVGEWLEGRPLLSAIVVQAESGSPGTGFFDLVRELGMLPIDTEDARMQLWVREVGRCFAERWPD